MRGELEDQGHMFSYISLEERVPSSHPLRKIRELVREVFAALDGDFQALYAREGPPSIPPEQLLSALLLQVFFSIRSERLLMEQMEYNLLFRWFAGLPADGGTWDATTFTKNCKRLQQGDIFNRFMTALLNRKDVRRLLSDEHFSVDGTLIEAWASHKSFRPKDDQDGDGDNFHGQKRRNDTHASVTDPEARLYKKGRGKESRLCYMGHATIENRHGLAVAGMVTQATGTAERTAALTMLKKTPAQPGPPHHRRGGQRLRHKGPCRGPARERHYAACGAERGGPQKRDRRKNDAACRLQHIAGQAQDGRMPLRLGQAAWNHAQNEVAGRGKRRRTVHAQSDRLQSRAHSQTAGKRIRGGVCPLCPERHGNPPKNTALSQNTPIFSPRQNGKTPPRWVFQQTARLFLPR